MPEEKKPVEPLSRGEEGRSAEPEGDPRSFDEAELLRVTLSSIGDAVITTDAHGRVTFLNPVAQTLTGWTNAKACGQSLERIFRVVNEESRAAVECPALRALRAGVIVGLANHSILIARDGTERPIDDSAAPIRDQDGRTAGAVLVFRDISERRKAEAATAYLAQIVSNSDDAIIGKNLDGIVTSWNRGAQRLFGYTSEEMVGEPVELLIPPAHADEERAILERLRGGDSVDHYETVRLRKDGSLVDISLTVSPVRDSAGRIIGAAKIARDITERKQALRKIHESEIRYRHLFQSAKDGILILDAVSRKIIDANAFMSDLTGIETSDLVGKELYEIGMFSDVEENKKAFRTLQRNKYLRQDHLPLRNRRGEKVEVEIIANVYHEGHRVVAQCNVRDISERVAMVKKIQEQTEALASESRRKDEFLAMLSHELRNPLAPIRSAVHLLRTRERPGPENIVQAKAHEIIERQVSNLTKIVSDLLEVSRVVSGRIRLHPQVVDVNEILGHAIDSCTPLVESHKHTLKRWSCQNPAWVSADPTRLEEVFVNLLTNAVKYTPDGGTIEAYCERPRGANFARVSIRDNGVGIDGKLLPRIFELFTQADRTLARAAGGLGIGLSLVQKLVELHGGTVDVNSPPVGRETGAEFIVELPLVPPPLVPRAKEPETSAAMPTGVRVLVVDDNIDLVMMFATLLRQQGYDVQAAYTGPEALEVALRWRPDVVLLDIGLPELDGYEVARRLRSAPIGSATEPPMRLIAISGYGRDIDVALAREAGFDAHLVKPVDFRDLMRTMARLAKH